MSEFLPLLEKILNQPFGWIGVTLVILLFGISKLAEKTVIRVEITHKFDVKEEQLAQVFEVQAKAMKGVVSDVFKPQKESRVQ